MEIKFMIGSVKANGIENSSCLNIGTNLLIGFSSFSKSTQGFGKISGDGGAMSALGTYIDDRDETDSPMWLGFDAESPGREGWG